MDSLYTTDVGYAPDDAVLFNKDTFKEYIDAIELFIENRVNFMENIPSNLDDID